MQRAHLMEPTTGMLTGRVSLRRTISVSCKPKLLSRMGPTCPDVSANLAGVASVFLGRLAQSLQLVDCRRKVDRREKQPQLIADNKRRLGQCYGTINGLDPSFWRRCHLKFLSQIYDIRESHLAAR